MHPLPTIVLARAIQIIIGRKVNLGFNGKPPATVNPQKLPLPTEISETNTPIRRSVNLPLELVTIETSQILEEKGIEGTWWIEKVGSSSKIYESLAVFVALRK